MKRTDFVSQPILAWMIILACFLFSAVIGFYGLSWVLIEEKISLISVDGNGSVPVHVLSDTLRVLKHQTLIFGLPSVFVVFLLWSFLLRNAVRRSVFKHLYTGQPPAKAKISNQYRHNIVSNEKTAVKSDKYMEQRLFAYWLKAFQREGRLLDFLFEELKDYSDTEVGAAVRAIQESCKKALLRHIRMTEVVSEMEGAEIVLERGFDAEAFQLVGNVRGEPPFTGVIRHRGWKVMKWDIPDLSGDVKPEIIMPAEVEIR